ncbi:MAG TPA: ABC transporter ATP-binding protein [Lachnospiraceae bacterium]|nr:ABC transporter ATP-binding protein [Lachnospiraceae bacterium]
MSEELLKVEHLKKYFSIRASAMHKIDSHALDDVSFDVKRGETFGIVGESGCGKTTLGRTILRIIEPTSGAITYDGADLLKADMRKYRSRMQIVFQDPYASLDPRMTVSDIIGEGLDLNKMVSSKSERQDKILAIMDTVGLSHDFYNRYPHEFSGGQRQRIGIARALIVNPEFVVCDEPVSALDVSIQAQIINMLEEIQKKDKLTYLFIAHDLAVVKHISNRIGVMYLGHLVEMTGSSELYANPQHPYTRMLLSAIPIADPDKAADARRIIAQGEIPSLIHPPTGCPFNTRCPFAKDICRQEIPYLKEKAPGSGHLTACHLVDSGEI